MGRLKTVTIYEVSEPKREFYSSHRRAETDDEAIDRAVRRHFGRAAWFWRDNGLLGMDTQYGQICKPLPGGGNNCITDRVGIRVS